MTVAICPACGYPTLGPDLCYYCRPMAIDLAAAATTPIPAGVGAHLGHRHAGSERSQRSQRASGAA